MICMSSADEILMFNLIEVDSTTGNFRADKVFQQSNCFAEVFPDLQLQTGMNHLCGISPARKKSNSAEITPVYDLSLLCWEEWKNALDFHELSEKTKSSEVESADSSCKRFSVCFIGAVTRSWALGAVRCRKTPRYVAPACHTPS